jgi:hypothetical protein
MKKALLHGLLASAFLSPFAAVEEAEARDYCREYTKSVRVDGRMQSGYGTACMQPDGSWMIVDAQGTVDPFDALRQQNVVIVAQQEPVYFDYGPRYRPVTYYAPRYAYAPRYRYNSPGVFFSFGYNDHGRHWQNHRGRDWHDNDHHGRRRHGHH